MNMFHVQVMPRNQLIRQIKETHKKTLGYLFERNNLLKRYTSDTAYLMSTVKQLATDSVS